MGPVVLLLSLFLTLLVCEGLFRLIRDLVKGGPQSQRAETIDDTDLGWTLNPGRKRIERLNSCGETVRRDPPPSPYLAKTPANREGMKILFLGDSFTHAHEVSTGGAYYDEFERRTVGNYSVFAAGTGGYGTAQEFLLLKKLVAEIQPHIIIWQLCTNDVAENVYTGTDLSTVQKPRPYFDLNSGELHVADPSFWILKHSDAAKFIYGQLAGLDRTRGLGLLKGLDWMVASHSKPADQVEEEGLEVLARLIGEAKRILPGVRIIGFSATRDFDDKYASIFHGHQIEYWEGVAAAVSKESERTDCAPLDAHWNHAGNAAAGRILARRLMEQ